MTRRAFATTILLSVLALSAGCALEGQDDVRSSAGASPGTHTDAGADAPTQGSGGELRIAHAAEPLLFRSGAGLALLAVRTSGDGTDGGILTAAYDGTWSEPLDLSTPGAQTLFPVAALNDRGAGVAVWTELAPGDDGLDPSPPVVARLRRADGSWSPSTQLAGIAYVDDVQVNARGDIAVYGSPEDGSGRVAVHQAGGRWSYSDLDWYGAASIALDEEGGVHAALTSTERGGGGAVSTTYLPPGGAWTAPEPVHTVPAASEPARILVPPDGSEVVVVGTVSPTWQSTFDTQYYWSTALQVLRRDDRDEPFIETQTLDGAAGAQSHVHSGSVELAWLQQADGKQIDGVEGQVTVPTREVLTVASLGGSEKALAQTTVERTMDNHHGTIEFAAGKGCAASAFVWRSVGVDDVPGDLAAEVGTGSTAVTSVWETTGDPVVPGLQGALACAGGTRPWVARVEDAVLADSADAGDRHLTDATVVVAPIS